MSAQRLVAGLELESDLASALAGVLSPGEVSRLLSGGDGASDGGPTAFSDPLGLVGSSAVSGGGSTAARVTASNTTTAAGSGSLEVRGGHHRVGAGHNGSTHLHNNHGSGGTSFLHDGHHRGRTRVTTTKTTTIGPDGKLRTETRTETVYLDEEEEEGAEAAAGFSVLANLEGGNDVVVGDGGGGGLDRSRWDAEYASSAIRLSSTGNASSVIWNSGGGGGGGGGLGTASEPVPDVDRGVEDGSVHPVEALHDLCAALDAPMATSLRSLSNSMSLSASRVGGLSNASTVMAGGGMSTSGAYGVPYASFDYLAAAPSGTGGNASTSGTAHGRFRERPRRKRFSPTGRAISPGDGNASLFPGGAYGSGGDGGDDAPEMVCNVCGKADCHHTVEYPNPFQLHAPPSPLELSLMEGAPDTFPPGSVSVLLRPSSSFAVGHVGGGGDDEFSPVATPSPPRGAGSSVRARGPVALGRRDPGRQTSPASGAAPYAQGSSFDGSLSVFGIEDEGATQAGTTTAVPRTPVMPSPASHHHPATPATPATPIPGAVELNRSFSLSPIDDEAGDGIGAGKHRRVSGRAPVRLGGVTTPSGTHRSALTNVSFSGLRSPPRTINL